MIFTLFSLASQPPVDMADKLRSEGKIYVVVISILLLFLGIALYVYLIDRRLRQLSKKIAPPLPEKKEESSKSLKE